VELLLLGASEGDDTRTQGQKRATNRPLVRLPRLGYCLSPIRASPIGRATGRPRDRQDNGEDQHSLAQNALMYTVPLHFGLKVSIYSIDRQ